jgi:hypothetical protein
MKLIFLICLALPSLSAFATDEIKLLKNRSVGLYTGANSISTNNSSKTALGRFGIEYTEIFNPKWSATVSYNVFLDDPSTLNSNISGFEVTGNWCLNICQPYKKKNEDLNISYYPDFSHFAFAGLSQKSFHLTSTSLTYSGLIVGYDASKFFKEDFSLFTRLSYEKLVSNANNADLMSVSFGLRWFP